MLDGQGSLKPTAHLYQPLLQHLLPNAFQLPDVHILWVGAVLAVDGIIHRRIKVLRLLQDKETKAQQAVLVGQDSTMQALAYCHWGSRKLVWLGQPSTTLHACICMVHSHHAAVVYSDAWVDIWLRLSDI